MTVIIRYGEIALKGGNRHLFEKRLATNIKDCLKKNNIKFEKVQRLRGRILVQTDDDCMPLKNVFGIVSFSPAYEVDLDIDEIKEKALELYTSGTFAIDTRRMSKKLMSSMEINMNVGAYIVEKTGARVDLGNPDCRIGVEVYDDFVLVFNKGIKAEGGLPVGTQAKVALILNDERSVEAGLAVMRRGATLVVVKEKDISIAGLKDYEYGFRLNVVDSVPDDVPAIVVSDTLETMKKYDTDKLVLRPLIAK